MKFHGYRRCTVHDLSRTVPSPLYRRKLSSWRVVSTGAFLWDEVTDWYRAAANVVGPLPPYRERIVAQVRDRTALAPQEEDRAGDLPVPAIRLVLLVVQ